ncbi:hypothetical protein J8655_08920 [Dickeya oryzae]|uniref:hypothetical protein n=1 Tax=Dickeya oryzae TaxID=1240404 RepID=UPI001AECAAE8|nr:hypothetical protein [Dickeya oryzae]MBP2845596.1 hypothetical protein [Dickeya oryzae]
MILDLKALSEQPPWTRAVRDLETAGLYATVGAEDIDQSIVLTGMWIAASSGVAHHEQGIASGMASTTLNLGNAIGLAMLVALANAGLPGFADESLRSGLSQGAQQAFYLAAAGTAFGVLITLTLPRKAANAAQSGEVV